MASMDEEDEELEEGALAGPVGKALESMAADENLDPEAAQLYM